LVTTHFTTVEEFETMSLEGLWELIDGELVSVTPASERSGSTASTVGGLLFQHIRAHRLGRGYGAETGFVLFQDRQTVLAPDVAFVSAERLPAEEDRDRFARLAPDFVVEVLSPSDRMGDALKKVALYLEAGVRLVWLVDPRKKTVTVFRPDAAPETFAGTMTIDGGDVLPGFSIPVAELFS
jgi:Uma2 family endonuclease